MSRDLLGSYDWSRFERVVVLSPHLDDAALSCGGLLAALFGRAPRLVVSACCGDAPPGGDAAAPAGRAGPPKLAPPAVRRREDAEAMRSIGCDFVHLGFADAAYRRSPATGELLYPEPRAYFSAPPVDDSGHVEELYAVLRRLVSGVGEVLLLGPLGIGHHVDHRICAHLALRLAGPPVSLLFYEDFPYVARDSRAGGVRDSPKRAMERLGCVPKERLSAPVDLEQKRQLISHYESQVPLLFGDEAGLREALAQANGERLWTARPRDPRR